MTLRPTLLAPLALFAAACAVPLMLTSCGGSEEVLLGRRSEVLAALGTNVILPSYRTLQTRAAALDAAIATYVASGLPADREAAQAAYLVLMESMMEVEMMTVGPLGAATQTPGGQDLFDEMYPWAVVPLSLCGVDRFLAGATYEDATVLDAEPLNIRGLGAVDYLLFVDTTANACGATAEINVRPTPDGLSPWETLAADPNALNVRRAAMAKVLSAQVKQRADALIAAWDPAFLLEFTDPTRSGGTYRTAQDGLNAVADALFVLDQVTKDLRLVTPAGIQNCATTICPEALESQFAGDNKERILGNLHAYRLIFTGGEGLGFDDLLVDVGAGDFAAEMLADIDAAIAAVDRVDGTLAEALVSDLDDVRALHDAVQLCATDLKTTFLSVLSLDPPNRAGSDND